MNEMVRPIRESIAETVKVFSQTLVNSGIYETLKKVREGAIETEKDLKLFKQAIVEMGYPPHVGMDIPTMRMIARKFRDEKEEAVDYIDDFMIEYYDFDVLRDIQATWETNEFLKDRIHIIRKVITAHNIGFYELSIPTILSQFEGLLMDAFEIEGFTNGEVVDTLLKTLLESKDYEGGFSFDKEIHAYYKENVLASFNHGKEITSGISRNAILHGGDKNYSTAYNSLKVILLFDNISQSLEFMKEETKSIGHKKGMKIVKRLEERKKKVRSKE